jgi:hypothetical protein
MMKSLSRWRRMPKQVCAARRVPWKHDRRRTMSVSSEANGRQEFLDRIVRELYDVSVRISSTDNGKQSGARRQQCVYGIFRAPILTKFRYYGSCPKIECEQLRQFLFVLLISHRIRSYFPSGVSGRSASAGRIHGMLATQQSNHRDLQEMSDGRQEFSIYAYIPSALCEDVDDQLFMFRFPPSFFWVRVNDRLDVVLDVPLLSTLVMQGNVARN